MARPSGPTRVGSDGLDEFTRLLDGPDGAAQERPPRHGRDRRPRRHVWPWILGILLVLALAVGGAAYWAYSTYPEQVKSLFGWSNDYPGSGQGRVDVEVRPGDLGSDVADTLVAQDVTKTRSAFFDLLVSKSPEPTFEPGTYRLRSHMSAAAALAALQDDANRIEATFTIPEGSTVRQILPVAAKATGLPLSELQAAAKDRAGLGIPKGARNIEGWLFPATYTFEPGTTAEDVLKKMIARTNQALGSAGVREGDRERVLTLAGLVQKESNGKDDAKVARVFLNRIKVGMRLQSDATVSYGAGGTTVVPTKKEKEDRNGYNTYLRDGLPVGPISNPGDVAIKAAVAPAKGKWLYFVTTNLKTGETKFTSSYAQHQKNADEFIRWLKAHPSYAK